MNENPKTELNTQFKLHHIIKSDIDHKFTDGRGYAQ